MANIQTENGYTPIATELIDAFCKYRLSGEEWQVLWVIIRKTWGWGKKEDYISMGQIAAITGLKRQNVNRAFKGLSSKKITVIKNDYRSINFIGINKDFETWTPVIKKDYCNQKRLQPVIKNDYKSVIEIDSHNKYNNYYTKDKRERNNFSPPSLDQIILYMTEQIKKQNASLDPVLESTKFHDHHETTGWMIKNTKMKNWEAACRTWIRYGMEFSKKHSAPAELVREVVK